MRASLVAIACIVVKQRGLQTVKQERFGATAA
jgi:hypothetical protein